MFNIGHTTMDINIETVRTFGKKRRKKNYCDTFILIIYKELCIRLLSSS